MQATVIGLVSPTQSNPGDTIEADDINTPINQLAAVVNGNIETANIADSAVTTAKIADATVTNAKLSTTAGEPGGAWATWTPSIANLTTGSGTLTGRSIKVGKTVHAQATLVAGAGSAITGSLNINLPHTASAFYTTASQRFIPIGQFVFFDTSGAAAYQGSIMIDNSTTLANVRVYNVSGTYATVDNLTAAIPAAVGTGDTLSFKFSYEAA